MNGVQWQRVKEVFVEACLLEPAEREGYLESACAGDSGLLAEVVALLAGQEEAHRLDSLSSVFVRPVLSALRPETDRPTQCGRYRVIDEIGRGGMGIVYRAYDPQLHREVALKLLSPSREDPEWHERLVAEARAASALDHPNVCTIYDIGESDDGRPYLAMAYYQGVTLKDRLKEGPLTPEQAVDVAIQVALALDHAHRAGIVHRDVKPANVMLPQSGGVKMLDFGIARREDGSDLTRTGARPGTPAYMAPEQVRGERIDARADVWSLGVVLYEMLTGRKPFRATSDYSLLAAILEREPTDPSSVRSDVSAELGRAVRQALQKDPAGRFQSADAFAAALRSVAARAPEPGGLTAAGWEREGGRPTLIGRDVEIAELTELLESSRLLTLTGPGGIGKTSLAIELGARCASAFPGGVYFVDLSLVLDPSLVPREIADGLGLAEHPGASDLEQIEERLAGRVSLLILDNFEQVVHAAAVVAELLALCPKVTVIATSRIPLALSAEQEYPVPPLGLPLPDAEEVDDPLAEWPAVRLFVERARRVRPGFTLSPANLEAVSELCRRLDGLPLAIELAAARIKMFSPAALVERISRRLDLLGGRYVDRPERHQTLEQAIAWSFDLLEPHLQRALEQLSVFSGGFTLEAAESVVSQEPGLPVVDALMSLHEHSLLQRTGSDDHPRYSLLVTIRMFAQIRAERGGVQADAARRHAEYFAALAERFGSELTGPHQEEALDQLESEQDNLRAAIQFAVDGADPELGLRIGSSLWRFWIVRAHLSEGRSHLQRLLQLSGNVEDSLRARALHGLSTLAHNQGDNRDSREYLEESLALWRKADDQKGLASGLNNLAWIACEGSDLERSESLSQEALELCREINDREGTALAYNNLGWVAMYRGLPVEAMRYHGESLRLRRHLGDRRGSAFALTGLAHAELVRGDVGGARFHVSDALRVFEALRDRGLSAYANVIRGQLAAWEGQQEEAVRILERAASLWRVDGNRSGLAYGLTKLGGAVLVLGDGERAHHVLEEALELWQIVECPWGVALTQYNQAEVAHAEQDGSAARSLYASSLELAVTIGDLRGQAECLEGLAQLNAASNEEKRALEQLEAARALRQKAELALPPHRREDLRRLERALRAALGVPPQQNQE